MTRSRLLAASLLLLGVLASGTVMAHGVRFGFHFGFPIFPPVWYHPPPVYYYPPPVVTMPPPAYIERADSQASSAPEHYWYYCPDSKTYYPYVRECASTWQRVSPRPPG